MISEYTIFNDGSQCYVCRTTDDVTMDEDGDMICTDCLFEKSCDEMFGNAYDEDDE